MELAVSDIHITGNAHSLNVAIRIKCMNVISPGYLLRWNWALSWENLFLPYANNKGAD